MKPETQGGHQEDGGGKKKEVLLHYRCLTPDGKCSRASRIK